MAQSGTADERLDFVVNLLTMLDSVCFDEQSNCIQGCLGKRSGLSFFEIEKKLESFDIDTSDNDSTKNILVIPLTSTNIYFDINHYLKNNSRRLDVKPKDSFYVYDISERYFPKVSDDNQSISNIFIIAELFENLKMISDIHGSLGNKSFVIFVGKKNLKINSEYVAEDLNFNILLVKRFIKEYIQNEFHNQDRHLSVINGLHEVFKEGEISLSVVLKNFETFYRVVKSNFQLYMDKFSFDDFKNKVEEDRREYTIKINKVFSDMQNQLLTLPIATLLAAGQMVYVASAGDFIKNILIVIGIIVFCVFVLMQISNQNNTLEALDNEMKLRKAEMGKKDDSDYKAEYLDVYTQLDKRIEKLNDNLVLVKNITLVATSLVFLVFITRFFF
ncbi:hypothetical protein EC846_2768 [Acinetobacter sp. BIGb0102]|uniref:hypothetical protein n=1 Tax=Acinetobacter sp. BIGb0102 TaxID=2485131 RepID=UPI000F5121C9|nr:hypothetical protein [Acinetobacter sp. BIGb0102]RPE28322.1 hypothetical protein EC846_2768 [Acinetobacter sp. BIGb0102]